MPDLEATLHVNADTHAFAWDLPNLEGRDLVSVRLTGGFSVLGSLSDARRIADELVAVLDGVTSARSAAEESAA